MFPTPLRREILILLAAKAAALTLLYVLFFSPMSRPDQADISNENHLLNVR